MPFKLSSVSTDRNVHCGSFRKEPCDSISVSAGNSPCEILLVEDDARLAAEVARFLRDSGMAVDLAAEGIDALHLAQTEPYDAIVLDLGLPGMDGLSVLKTLRGRSVNTAVLF